MNVSAVDFSWYAAMRCLASRSSVFVPSDWTSRPALIRWKSGSGRGGPWRPCPRSRPGHLVGLLAERQLVLRLGGPGLLLRLVEGPLVERDHRLPGRLDGLLAELDRLGQDDLLLGGQQGDLADLLEVHPDGIVDPDHVRGERLELLGGRLLELGRVELGRGIGRQDGARRLALDRDVDDLFLLVGRDQPLRRRAELEIGLEVLVLVIVDLGRHVGVGDGRVGRPAASRPAGPPRSRPSSGAAGREHRFDELLVQ